MTLLICGCQHILVSVVKGFYISWTNDPPNPKIKDWNVTELKVRLASFASSSSLFITVLTYVQIDPHRRHVDKSVVAHLWKTLDTWTTTNKPWLMK